ncbi:hypothetical protein SLEP1_g51557 [Rubroshorea leprosula]|uniref:Cell wall anchor protein n=1 Tax=Rubroshorea leprosula TaxID=152421 RepID=A0AAV5M5S1_9ROSI|nr:hypothetical protein SLEP1_g51557 [Rubroshorea leprosula]
MGNGSGVLAGSYGINNSGATNSGTGSGSQNSGQGSGSEHHEGRDNNSNQGIQNNNGQKGEGGKNTNISGSVTGGSASSSG